MPIFCHRCKTCGARFEVTERQVVEHDDCTGTPEIVRDYSREGVNIGPAIGAINRDKKADDDRNLFLPTRKDFESPSDPDGSKGVKDWNERHSNPADKTGRMRPR